MTSVRLFALSICLVGLAAPAHAIEMKAGTAKCVITPQQPLVMVTGRLSKGVDHDIYARCLVLNDGAKRMVILTYDLNCLDVATPILRKRCRDELGIDAPFLVLLGTHNHEAPIQIVPDNFKYGRWLAERMFDLIKEAITNERGPVKIEMGTGNAYFVVSVGNAPTDFEVQLLKVSMNDKPIALFFTHPTHPMQATSDRIGVGHPGYAVNEVEKEFPGALALYGDACGGNQFAGGFSGPLDKVKALGGILAKRVARIANGELLDITGPLDSRLEVISLPLAPPIPYEKALELAEKIDKNAGFVPYPDPRRKNNWIRNLLKHYEENLEFPTRTTDMVCTDDTILVKEYKEPREFPCRYEEVIISRIGPMILIAMQGEVCAPIGMRIKDAFRGKTPAMVTAYMGEHNLYIPTRELVRLKAYQARVIQIQYACPVEWDPEVEDVMVKAVIRLGREMASEIPAQKSP